MMESDPHEEESSNNNKNNSDSNNNKNRRQRIRNRFEQAGKTLQKFNLAKLIDNMEHDQQFADHLDVLNRDTQEEAARKDLCREAVDRCHAAIATHLDEFLDSHDTNNNNSNNTATATATATVAPSYEEWIQSVHPENVTDGTLLTGLPQVDARFYVATSDHRLLWNDRVPTRPVPARTAVPMTQPRAHEEDARAAVDLLG